MALIILYVQRSIYVQVVWVFFYPLHYNWLLLLISVLMIFKTCLTTSILNYKVYTKHNYHLGINLLYMTACEELCTHFKNKKQDNFYSKMMAFFRKGNHLSINHWINLVWYIYLSTFSNISLEIYTYLHCIVNMDLISPCSIICWVE